MTHPDGTTAFLAENLEDLYENAPCGYISTLPDGTFAKMNRTFLTWTGYQPDTLCAPMRFQELLTIPGRIFYETHYTPLLQMQGFVREMAFDLRCRDGTLLPVFINAVQYRDASGNPVLHRTTLFDARERRAYERELQVARNKAEQALIVREHFLALAAHELRTPVTSILGNAQLLQRHTYRDSSLNPRDQRALHLVIEQTKRLSTLVQSLLDVSRIESGQLAIERAVVDVTMLLYRIVDEMQLIVDQHEIKLRFLASSVRIYGDELRLEQVFRNLIDNARKYSAPQSQITVVIRQRDPWVYVEVHDTGMGIPADALPHLFQRFYRASNVHDETHTGIGIGLYVVKEIVDLHGGEVTVTSSEGQGTTVTVCLPVGNIP